MTDEEAGVVLTVTAATSTERLVGDLARLLADGGDVFTAEVVAVPNAGMRRWVTQALAHRLGATGAENGICAGIRLPFPGALIAQVVAQASGTDPAADPWRPDALSWTIAGLLEVAAADADTMAELAPLIDHLRGDDGTLVRQRRLPLARSLADQLDRYAVHRPDMIDAWRDGRRVTVGPDGTEVPLEASQRWQHALWTACAEAIDDTDPVARRAAAITALHDGTAQVDLPDRVVLFAVGALPPALLAVVAALAAHRDVHLMALSSGRPDHPLVQRLGRVGTAGAARLAALTGGAQLEVTPGADHLGLGLHDVPGTEEGGAQPADPADQAPPAVGDRPIEVHRCAGLARQIDAVRDAIASRLDGSVRPHEIAVATPDVAAVEPLVRAAFASHGHRQGLPVQISDRALTRENPLAAVVMDVLALVASRRSASEVLDLIGAPEVLARHGLERADLEQIDAWVADAGIRWGLDADHRDAVGAAHAATNTWRAGIDRLLIGVASPAHDNLVLGVAPVDDIEGDRVELLGRFLGVLDVIDSAVERLAGQAPPGEWRRRIEAVTDALAAVPDADRWQRAELSEALSEALPDGPDLLIDVGEVRSALAADLPGRPGAARYGTGAITVSGLSALRGVPHDVVVLCGIDDGALGGGTEEPGWDLLAASPRPSDPDGPGEVRQQLLDAIASARQGLIIVTSDRDPRTGQPVPAPAPLEDLLGHLDTDLPDRVATFTHPLQPFAPQAFGRNANGTAGPVLSGDAALATAAEAWSRPDTELVAFAPERLDVPEVESWQLDELARFWRDPATSFARATLGLRWYDDAHVVDDRDPELAAGLAGSLERWQVRDALLEALVTGGEAALEARLAFLRAAGTVPTGAPGAHAVRGELDDVRAVHAAVVEPLAGAAERVPVDVLIDVDGRAVRVHGEVEVHGDAVIAVVAGRLTPRRRVELWLRLLAAQVHVGDGRPLLGVLAHRPGRDKATAHRILPGPVGSNPVTAAREALAVLVEGAQEGLSRPLWIHPDVSDELWAVDGARAVLEGLAAQPPHAVDANALLGDLVGAVRARVAGAWEPGTGDWGRPLLGERGIRVVAGHADSSAALLDAMAASGDLVRAAAVWSRLVAGEQAATDQAPPAKAAGASRGAAKGPGR